MICRHCGNEIRDDARFCPHCGAAAGPEGVPPQGTASYSAAPAWEGPEGGGKKKKTGLIIGIAVAAVAVAAVLSVVLGGLFSNPKKQVEAAFVKTAAAYAQAEQALNMPDVSQWQKEQLIAQSMSLALENTNSDLIGYDLSALNGLALGVDTSYNGPDRYMGFELFAHWGEDELFALRMTADDDKFYFNSPQLTGETYYGVNTETFGSDIAQMTGDDSVKDVSFNLFDLVDKVMERMDPQAMEDRIKEANKALWAAAQIKKEGSKTLDLNGTETKTAAYRVTVPQEALEDYADALVEVMSAMSYYDLYEEIYRSMGMPQEQIDEILDMLEEFDAYGALSDDLKDAIGEIGDLELEVCLSGGYVSALLYEDRVSGSDVSVSVYLGGGEAYVDDLSLELEVDGVKLAVTSTGDHGGKSGVFTDKTTIKGDPLKAASLNSITSEFRYEPKKSGDNFSWKLAIPGAGSLDMSGSLITQPSSIALDLDDISLKVIGMDVCTLSLSYRVENRASSGLPVNVQIITQMNEQELMTMVLDTQQRALQWASDMEALFVSRLPDELLYGMMY